LVPAGTHIPDGSLFAGVPGKLKKTLSEKQRSSLAGWAKKYLEVSKAHQSLE
jgi:carbonic anhydrase/acetyltransferase-like protein (isoleucine patch superfamily)